MGGSWHCFRHILLDGQVLVQLTVPWQFHPHVKANSSLGTEVWSSQLSINLQLFQSLHLRGTQGDPRGIPWMTPLRDARRLDGLGQMTSRKALHVRGNELSWSGLDWDLYMYYIVLLCTQSIPSENTMSSVRKLPQHEESLASVWDLDMLACCRPQHGPPNYDPCREIWPFMNGLFTIRLLL